MSTSKNLDYILHPDHKQTDQEHTQSQSANMCRRCCTETLQPPKKNENYQFASPIQSGQQETYRVEKAHLVVPLPSFGVDRFTHSSQDFEAGEVKALHLLHTKLHQGSDGGGRRVEFGHPMLSNDLPAPLVIRVEWGALEKHTGGCIEQGTIGDLSLIHI